MAKGNMALMEYLRKLDLGGDLDFPRESVRMMSQLLMEAEVEERVGEVPLRIPKLQRGSHFPSLLEPRRKAEQALLDVIQEAYAQGVSTPKVDALVQRLALTGIDKTRVSRICKEVDREVKEFRGRALKEEMSCC